MSKQRRKQPQGHAGSGSTNDVDWERVAQDLYRRGVLKIEHLDSRPIRHKTVEETPMPYAVLRSSTRSGERAHDAHTAKRAQSNQGAQRGRLIPNQIGSPAVASAKNLRQPPGARYGETLEEIDSIRPDLVRDTRRDVAALRGECAKSRREPAEPRATQPFPTKEHR